MNKIFIFFIILLVGLQSSAQISVNGFTLRHCTSEQICLEVLGTKAYKSSLADIWSVNNSQVRVIDLKKNITLQEWIQKMVIVDEVAQQVMVMDADGGQEWQIALKTVQVMKMF